MVTSTPWAGFENVGLKVSWRSCLSVLKLSHTIGATSRTSLNIVFFFHPRNLSSLNMRYLPGDIYSLAQVVDGCCPKNKSLYYGNIGCVFLCCFNILSNRPATSHRSKFNQALPYFWFAVQLASPVFRTTNNYAHIQEVIVFISTILISWRYEMVITRTLE